MHLWLCGVYSNFNEHERTQKDYESELRFSEAVVAFLHLVKSSTQWERCAEESRYVYIYAWTKHSSGTIYVAFRQFLKIWDCPGDSGAIGAYDNNNKISTKKNWNKKKSSNKKFKFFHRGQCCACKQKAAAVQRTVGLLLIPVPAIGHLSTVQGRRSRSRRGGHGRPTFWAIFFFFSTSW